MQIFHLHTWAFCSFFRALLLNEWYDEKSAYFGTHFGGSFWWVFFCFSRTSCKWVWHFVFILCLKFYQSFKFSLHFEPFAEIVSGVVSNVVFALVMWLWSQKFVTNTGKYISMSSHFCILLYFGVCLYRARDCSLQCQGSWKKSGIFEVDGISAVWFFSGS